MSDDAMKALADRLEAHLEKLANTPSALSMMDYDPIANDILLAARTLRAALAPPADEPGWLKGMDEASAVREITAQMGVPPADDEIVAIRGRHQADNGFESDGLDSAEWRASLTMLATRAHTDRATLLRALAAERAVNAVPELLALREEVGRLREQVRELSDCQRLPKVYRYTGTAEVDVADMFDVGHRHRNGKQPRDYLMSWLSMFRPFAYATKDDSWGELEKLISIVMNNYVQILARAEKARAALNQEPGQ